MQAPQPPLWKRHSQNVGMDQKVRVLTPVRTERPVTALGRRLREARLKSEKTQAEVGEYLELSSHSSVGQWERGKTLIGTINLILAAQFYKESLDWLVFGMRGTIEKRIAALPESLREGLMEQVTAAVENAERLWRRNPGLFSNEVVPDSDPRLSEWSAKDKPKKRVQKRRIGGA